MSKNFRSSFVDLLCCRYTKRQLFLNNESLRSRAIHRELHSRSFYGKNDYFTRNSIASRISQITPVATALGLTASASLTHFPSDLSPMYPRNGRRVPKDDSCYASFELAESSRQFRRRSEDPSLAAMCYSTTAERAQVLLTPSTDAEQIRT